MTSVASTISIEVTSDTTRWPQHTRILRAEPTHPGVGEAQPIARGSALLPG